MKKYNTFRTSIDSNLSVSEDKKAREARREERREKKFKDTDRDFNLNKFMQVLSALKNSIAAIIVECDYDLNNTDKEIASAKKTSGQYREVFRTQLRRVSALIAQAQYRKDKDESKYLEAGGEYQTLIDTFRKQYDELKSDFEDSSKKYKAEKGKEIDKETEDMKYSSILDPFKSAIESFNEAGNIFGTLKIIELADQAASSTPDSSSKSDENTKIEIKKDIKSGTTPSGEDGELTKKVYKLICDRWSKSKTLTATNQWKKSIFCTPKSLIIGPNRTACIKAIKAAYGIKDTTGNITQELADELKKSEVVTESINYVIESSRVLSFSDFLSKKSRTNEKVNIEALKKSLGEPVETSDNKKEKSKESWESPFKDREEGNAFRKWVNENDPEFAKKIELDKEGSHTNSYIRKAWKELGEIYSKYKEQKKAGEESKAKAEAKAKIEAKAKKDAEAKKKKGISEKQAKEIAKKILVAMSGATEDEEEVLKIFKKEIRDKETFDYVEKAWRIFSPNETDLKQIYWNKYDADKLFSKERYRKNGFHTLKDLFKKYYTNIDELRDLRKVLPKGVDI